MSAQRHRTQKRVPPDPTHWAAQSACARCLRPPLATSWPSNASATLASRGLPRWRAPKPARDGRAHRQNFDDALEKLQACYPLSGAAPCKLVTTNATELLTSSCETCGNMQICGLF